MRPPPQIETPTIEFPKHWINRAEALRLIGRGKTTLWKWEKAGLIQRRNRGGVHVFEVNQLLRARDKCATRMKSTQFRQGNDGHVAQRKASK